jgi:hypothetical protein
MVSNCAEDIVISMEGDADPFFIMRMTTASKSFLDKSFLLLCGGSAVEGSMLSRHQFESAAATLFLANSNPSALKINKPTLKYICKFINIETTLI